jgi:methanogenic corrinoid protein MtbC1
MRLLRRRDDGDLRRYLRELMDQGHGVDVVFDDLLAPAARRLGHLWESDDYDFMEVTLACARLQSAVRRMGRTAEEPGAGYVRGRLLLCGMTDDQHTLGGILLAEIFIRDGWMVTLAPPFARGRPAGEYDLICFSLASLDRADAAARRLEALRRRHGPDAKLILGGNAILRDPDLVNAFNADGWAPDADGAAALARELAPAQPQAVGAHETAHD